MLACFLMLIGLLIYGHNVLITNNHHHHHHHHHHHSSSLSRVERGTRVGYKKHPKYENTFFSLTFATTFQPLPAARKLESKRLLLLLLPPSHTFPDNNLIEQRSNYPHTTSLLTHTIHLLSNTHLLTPPPCCLPNLITSKMHRYKLGNYPENHYLR